MKDCCKECKSIYNDKIELHEHTFLLTVLSKESKNLEECIYLFYCTKCCSLHRYELMDTGEKIERYENEINNELIEKIALALFAENRMKYVHARQLFLKKNLMPIYDPIYKSDLDTFNNSLNSNDNVDSNVIYTPYFDHWHDNVEDALNDTEEDEWEPMFSFSYAEPIDLKYISSNYKMPRYYRTYLVPADEVEAFLSIEKNQPNRLSIWKQSLSRLEKVTIWDEQEQRHLPIEEFNEIVSEMNLWMDVSLTAKEEVLKPYKESIKANLINKETTLT